MFDMGADLTELLSGYRASLPARQAELERQDLGEGPLLQLAAGAWARRDPVELTAAGRLLAARGPVSREWTMQIALGLSQNGLFQEAADLLARGLGEAPRSGGFVLLASTLAAAGRLDEAHVAAEAAVRLKRGEPKAERTLSLLATVRRLWPRSDLTWREALACVEALLALGARAPAAEALRRVAAQAPPAQQAEELEAAAALARIGLGLVSAQDLSPLMKRLSKAAPRDRRIQALWIRWLARAGKADQACTEAAAGGLAGDDSLDARLAAAEALESAGALEGAIEILSGLAAERDRDLEVRGWLACCIGRLVTARPLRYAPPRPRRVISLFPFYNELTILKIRLREMADWVDQFVIVEAAETFTGAPKPFHFDEFRSAVAEFEPKILRVRIDAFPPCCARPWAREFYQRDMAITALDGVWRPDDLVLVSDVDEIVSRTALEGMRAPLASLRMRTHAYFLNYCAAPGTAYARRRSGFACRADVLSRFGSSYIRMALLGRTDGWWEAPQAGWHLTSIGDGEAIANKCRSFSHQDADMAEWRDADLVQARLDAIRAGGDGGGWERRDIDDSFPAYVRERQEELKDLLL